MLIDHLKAAGISRVHDLWVFKLSVLIASLFLNGRKLVVVECGHTDKQIHSFRNSFEGVANNEV